MCTQPKLKIVFKKSVVHWQISSFIYKPEISAVIKYRQFSSYTGSIVSEACLPCVFMWGHIFTEHETGRRCVDGEWSTACLLTFPCHLHDGLGKGLTGILLGQLEPQSSGPVTESWDFSIFTTIILSKTLDNLVRAGDRGGLLCHTALAATLLLPTLQLWSLLQGQLVSESRALHVQNGVLFPDKASSQLSYPWTHFDYGVRCDRGLTRRISQQSKFFIMMTIT